MLTKLPLLLTALAALAFGVAVLTSVGDFNILNTPAEGYSRASANLALVAIALSVLKSREEVPAEG